MLNLNTEERGLELCKLYLDEKLWPAIFAGSHTFNPYHNERHELQTVYHAYRAWLSMGGSVHDIDLCYLIAAAAFHDHNHSGGALSDAENIKAAVIAYCALRLPSFNNVVSPSTIDLGVDAVLERLNSGTGIQYGTHCELRAVVRTIQCTQFNGASGFEREPQNMMERCIRDADLMAIYTAEGRVLTRGLAQEMGTEFSEEFAQKSFEFLNAQTAYTPYGQAMKTESLEVYARMLKRDAERERRTLMASRALDDFRANGT